MRNDCVFQINGPVLDTQFRKICNKIGLETLHIHDLRHTFASRLAGKGEDISVIQRLLNHKTLSQTARYVHHQAETLRSAVMKLSK